MKGKELIEEIAKYISIGTWKPKSSGNDIWLERVVTEGVEYIHFGTSRTSTYGFEFYGRLSSSKKIKVIEDLLKPLYKKQAIGYEHKTILHSSSREFPCPDIQVETIDDVQKVMPWVNERLEADILPFFNHYNSLERVHQKVLQLPKSEMSQFIYPVVVIKLLTIKGLLNTEDYKEFRDWAIDVYKDMTKGQTSGQNFITLQVLEELSVHFSK